MHTRPVTTKSKLNCLPVLEPETIIKKYAPRTAKHFRASRVACPKTQLGNRPRAVVPHRRVFSQRAIHTWSTWSSQYSDRRLRCSPDVFCPPIGDPSMVALHDAARSRGPRSMLSPSDQNLLPSWE